MGRWSGSAVFGGAVAESLVAARPVQSPCPDKEKGGIAAAPLRRYGYGEETPWRLLLGAAAGALVSWQRGCGTRRALRHHLAPLGLRHGSRGRGDAHDDAARGL